jgi:hypothetical protein
VLCGAGGAEAGPKPNETPVPLSISVFNDADVPAVVLGRARDRAMAVFAQAGVELTWLDCGTPARRVIHAGCAAIAYPTHFSIRLVENSVGVAQDAFGQSFQNERGEGNYANVYVGPLASSKALSVVNEGDLLGCVVAHEVGHLLLGVNSHSSRGLMRGFWRAEELYLAANGELMFSASETDRLRARYFAAREKQSVGTTDGARSGD